MWPLWTHTYIPQITLCALPSWGGPTIWDLDPATTVATWREQPMALRINYTLQILANLSSIKYHTPSPKASQNEKYLGALEYIVPGPFEDGLA